MRTPHSIWRGVWRLACWLLVLESAITPVKVVTNRRHYRGGGGGTRAADDFLRCVPTPWVARGRSLRRARRASSMLDDPTRQRFVISRVCKLGYLPHGRRPTDTGVRHARAPHAAKYIIYARRPATSALCGGALAAYASAAAVRSVAPDIFAARACDDGSGRLSGAASLPLRSTRRLGWLR